MSIPVSYDLAAFNIAQQVKFKEDINTKEARLGVWKITHSVYYVSSSDCKIAKLWFDFLKLIGLVVDPKDKKFTEVVNASANKFGQLDHIFNTQKYDDITKLRNRLVKAKQAQKQLIQDLTNKNQEFLNSTKALTENVSKLKGDIASTSNASKTASDEAQKQKIELDARYSTELKDRDKQIAELKSSVEHWKEINSKNIEGSKKSEKSFADQLAQKDQICKNFTLGLQDLQREKVHLQDQLKAKDEQIRKMSNDNATLLSEKKHNEKQHQDHALHVVKMKDDHNRAIRKQTLDTEEYKVKYEKAMTAIEDKDTEIKQLKAQIEALKANSVTIEEGAQ